MNLKSKLLAAFTLIEMLVVLLISGLLSGFVYLSMVIINDYYGSISNRLHTGLRHEEIIYILKSDVASADWIEKTDKGFSCNWSVGKHVLYVPVEKGIVRTQLSRIDTLATGKNETSYVMVTGDSLLISLMQINAALWQTPLVMEKEYTAQALFDWRRLTDKSHGD